MDWHERIASDPDILLGKPTIKGTRISVELILGWLANGWTHERILGAYPQLSQEDILAALAFAKAPTPPAIVYLRQGTYAPVMARGGRARGRRACRLRHWSSCGCADARCPLRSGRESLGCDYRGQPRSAPQFQA